MALINIVVTINFFLRIKVKFLPAVLHPNFQQIISHSCDVLIMGSIPSVKIVERNFKLLKYSLILSYNII